MMKWAVVIAVGTIIGACSRAEAPGRVERTIGPEGGSVTVGTVSLDIPPGALDESKTIVITETDEGAPADTDARSPVFRFEPDGLVFKAPIRVRFTVTDPTDAEVQWTGPSSAFEPLATTIAGNEVSATTTHFCRGTVVVPRCRREKRCPPRDAGVDAPVDAATDVATPVDAASDTGVVDGSVTDASDAAVGSGAFVQSAAFTRQATNPSAFWAALLPAQVDAGDMIVAAYMWNHLPDQGDTIDVTDTLGTTYQLAFKVDQSVNNTLWFFYGFAASTGSPTVTVHFAESTSFVARGAAVHYRGLTTADGSNTWSSGVTTAGMVKTFDSGPVALTGAGPTTLIAIGTVNMTNMNVAAGSAKRYCDSSGYVCISDAVVAAPGTAKAGFVSDMTGYVDSSCCRGAAAGAIGFQ